MLVTPRAGQKLLQMTDEEIRSEISYWEIKLKEAAIWGTALPEADEFIKNAMDELNRRKQWAFAPHRASMTR